MGEKNLPEWLWVNNGRRNTEISERVEEMNLEEKGKKRIRGKKVTKDKKDRNREEKRRAR